MIQSAVIFRIIFNGYSTVLSIQPALSQSLFAILKANRAVLLYLHFLTRHI